MTLQNGIDERELSRQDVSEESSGGLERAKKPVLSFGGLESLARWQGGDGSRPNPPTEGTTDGLLPILTILKRSRRTQQFGSLEQFFIKHVGVAIF